MGPRRKSLFRGHVLGSRIWASGKLSTPWVHLKVERLRATENRARGLAGPHPTADGFCLTWPSRVPRLLSHRPCDAWTHALQSLTLSVRALRRTTCVSTPAPAAQQTATGFQVSAQPPSMKAQLRLPSQHPGNTRLCPVPPWGECSRLTPCVSFLPNLSAHLMLNPTSRVKGEMSCFRLHNLQLLSHASFHPFAARPLYILFTS